MCYKLDAPPGALQGQPDAEFFVGDEAQAGDACWITIAQGADWIRSVDDYAEARLTVTAGGGQR